MKSAMRVVVCAAGLLLGACGGQTMDALESGDVPDAPPAETEVQGRVISVRLRGLDASAYEAVRLPLQAVRVTAAGRALPVELVGTEVDLSREGHAALVARFALPDGVESVDVAVEFGGTGAVTRGGTTESVDLSVPPIRFTSQAAWLTQHDHAVVHLSVARSLVRAGGSLLLLPNLSVHH